MDGREYELTPALVRSRLAGQSPGDIRQYWVEIDDVRWPVKQVLRLSTGSSDFQSQTAQRHLLRLGFTVGGGAMPREGSSGTRPHRLRFELAELTVIETIEARIWFEWHRAGRVTLDTAGFPQFPPMPRLPGLYRFDFGGDAAGVRTLYIGESEDLRNRVSQYRNAKKDGGRNRTSRRIHLEVVAHLSAGGSVEFAITTDVRVAGDFAADLRRKSARRMAENAAVLEAQTTHNVRVLNIDADLGTDDEHPVP
jgi:hypothetical protein